MARVYVRKFDWDDARRRYAAGETLTALAREYGVSSPAVQYAVNRESRERMQRYVQAFQQSGICEDCGAKCSRTGGRAQRCRRCSARAQATSVRDDELRCGTCHVWKPDRDFPWNRATSVFRRGRHLTCRSCHTKIKRAYRERTRVPCSEGCGRLANSADLLPGAKPRCRECFYEADRARRRAAA